MRKILAVLAATILVIGLSSCEPQKVITASAYPTNKPDCGTTTTIKGFVPDQYDVDSVILQRTRSGKWVDWLWHQEYTQPIYNEILSAPVRSNGYFDLRIRVPSDTNVHNIRVRSADSKYASNSVYLSPVKASPWC